MSNLERVTRSSVTLWRQLPVPARVAVVVVSLLAVLYLWQIALGFVFLAAIFIGLYQMIRWLVR